MMNFNYVVIFFLFLFLVAFCIEPDQCDGKVSQNTCGLNKKFENTQHYNIILLGATGNLARKYLWRALFDFYIERISMPEKYSFRIYAASRDTTEDGRKFLSSLFINYLKCAEEICKKYKKKFVEAVQYVRLKTTKDYKELESLLDENTQTMFGLDKKGPNTYETGRLFYFSIPPSAYIKTAAKIHDFLRPKLGHPWVRLVLEKPFGLDIDSATNLAEELARYFKEDEIYRVDHYLAKSVVHQIIPLRYINKNVYDSIWNRHHIEKIDIVMKEKEDVRDRTSFYEEAGVIRDVFQNHLTELMALIAMELPEDSGSISDMIHNKVQLLKECEPLSGMNLVTGQYSTYNLELIGQNNLSSSHISRTPTFGAVVMRINNDRWRGVPFVFVSGKKLDEKTSYIHIHFRQNRFCLRKNGEDCSHKNFLQFRINGDALPFIQSSEFIAVSNDLPKFEVIREWKNEKISTPQMDNTNDNVTGHIATHNLKIVKYFGVVASSYLNVYSPKKPVAAYTVIISAAIDGLRHQFVSRDFLMQSWRIWDGIAKHAHMRKPRQYFGIGKDSERLDTLLDKNGHVGYYYDDKNNISSSVSYDWVSVETLSHLDYDIHVGDTESIIQKLSMQIVRDIDLALGKGLLFHIALSGGVTPIPLFQRLCNMAKSWHHVHIWQVDERCVVNKERQNFITIEKHLINNCDIPFSNIHPISPSPTCPPGSATAYEFLISNSINKSSFDYIVLGLGSDGHVASLFPEDNKKEYLNYDDISNDDEITKSSDNDSISKISDDYVNSNTFDDKPSTSFSEVKIKEIETTDSLHIKLVGYSKISDERRISLSLSAINLCKKCVILATGIEKSDIVAKVLASANHDNLLVRKIVPLYGKLEWFIDTSAFSKTKNIL